MSVSFVMQIYVILSAAEEIKGGPRLDIFSSNLSNVWKLNSSNWNI